MRRGISEFVVLGAVCFVAVLATTVGQTIAATKKARESTPVAVAKPAKQQSDQERNPSIQRAKKRQPEAIQKQAKPIPTELKPTSPNRHRGMKVHKKETPKAVVQPRTDLMYHGMLESPQRYNPRRNHLGAGVLDPHTPELTHDHFQELDRNQDGKVDPVERVFGRLDMDRDLYDRQPR